MATHTTTIEIEVEVEYTMIPGSSGDWETPDEHPTVDMGRILIHTMDISNLLSAEQKDELEASIYESLDD